MGCLHFVKTLDNGEQKLPFGDKVPGTYKVLIRRNYKPKLHGPSRIIDIGSSNNLSKRIGTFMAAAMGFNVDHSAGKTFYRLKKSLRLTIRDLELTFIGSHNHRGKEFSSFENFINQMKKSPSKILSLGKLREKYGLSARKKYPLLCSRRPSR